MRCGSAVCAATHTMLKSYQAGPFVATAPMKSFHNLVCCVACVVPKQMLPFPGLVEPSSRRYSDLVTRMMAVHALCFKHSLVNRVFVLVSTGGRFDSTSQKLAKLTEGTSPTTPYRHIFTFRVRHHPLTCIAPTPCVSPQYNITFGSPVPTPKELSPELSPESIVRLLQPRINTYLHLEPAITHSHASRPRPVSVSAV